MGTWPTLMQRKTLPRVADPNGFVQSRLRRFRHVTVDGAMEHVCALIKAVWISLDNLGGTAE